MKPRTFSRKTASNKPENNKPETEPIVERPASAEAEEAAPDWMIVPQTLDHIIAAPPAPSQKFTMPAHGDITRLSNEELLRVYWAETEQVSFAKGQLALFEAKKIYAKENARDKEANFRFSNNNLSKVQQDLTLSANEEWRKAHKALVETDALVVALEGRIAGWLDRIKTMSRELTRRGMDVTASSRGI